MLSNSQIKIIHYTYADVYLRVYYGAKIKERLVEKSSWSTFRALLISHEINYLRNHSPKKKKKTNNNK